MAKLKLAIYWAAGCGGCDVAILDTKEKVLEIGQIADIVLWPIATDHKYEEIEKMADGAIDVCLFNGGVRNSENEHLARLLRAKSKILVAFGACAHLGGIPGLVNLFTKEEVFNCVFRESQSIDNPNEVFPKPQSSVPEGELSIPEFYNTLLPLKAVVDVEKGIMAIDAELHADEEAMLLANSSKQANLWGINLYPELSGDDFIEFDSMINLRPSQNNRSRSVDDEVIQNKIKEIINNLVKDE